MTSTAPERGSTATELGCLTVGRSPAVRAAPEFTRWAGGRARLLLEDFYRDARRWLALLLDGDQPAGGAWNFDAANRQPPPRGAAILDVPAPYAPREDDIDAQVREDLHRWEREGIASFVGADGPREFAVTRAEALDAFGVTSDS